MKAMKITEEIYWVGAIDWSIRNFHGYATSRGTTYGAYLILDEKITLIDTVKAEFTEELLSRISDVIDPSKIDLIISNHVEMDHSGALPVLQKRCPKALIYTSGAAGIKGLTAHYGEFPYHSVKHGDVISIGKRTLSFLATPMLHWPDNMLTYCPEEQILFSNDSFGQHLASFERFDDELPLSLILEEAKKYYANIIMCYGKQAQAAFQLVSKLPLSMIAPSHGIIFRSHIAEILDAYSTYSENTPKTGALVVFDSMWHSTAKIAATIAESFVTNGVPCKLYDLKVNHYSNIIPDLLTCRYLAVGSPTLNNQMLPSVASFLCYLKGLSPKNRLAFSFGSYGWSGQSIPLIEQELEQCGFDLCLRGIKIAYLPSAKDFTEIEKLITTLLTTTNSKNESEKKMNKYVCEPCGYIYDPEEGDSSNGIAPGTPFENLPDDWVCPICGLSKDVFSVSE